MNLSQSTITFILQLLQKYANLSSIDNVLALQEEMTKKDILAQHKYAITLNKDGRYSTYLPDDTKSSKRRKVVKPSQELLEKEIVRFYKDKENKKQRTHALNIWAHSVVRKNNLTKKQYYNMTIIIRQSLDMAVEIGIINENSFQKVKMESKLFKPVKKKSDETQVFLTDEKKLVEQEAYTDFEASIVNPMIRLLWIWKML